VVPFDTLDKVSY